jgi:hypothetical protein
VYGNVRKCKEIGVFGLKIGVVQARPYGGEGGCTVAESASCTADTGAYKAATDESGVGQSCVVSASPSTDGFTRSNSCARQRASTSHRGRGRNDSAVRMRGEGPCVLNWCDAPVAAAAHQGNRMCPKVFPPPPVFPGEGWGGGRARRDLRQGKTPSQPPPEYRGR